MCDTVTEFGLHHGHSMVALIAGRPRAIVSVDVRRPGCVESLAEMADEVGVHWEFHEADSRCFQMQPTDLLHIDSTHLGAHLRVELAMHAEQVGRFLVFHDSVKAWDRGWTYKSKPQDIVSYGDRGAKRYGLGIGMAIEEFLQNHREWQEFVHDKRKAGMLVLERV